MRGKAFGGAMLRLQLLKRLAARTQVATFLKSSALKRQAKLEHVSLIFDKIYGNGAPTAQKIGFED